LNLVDRIDEMHEIVVPSFDAGRCICTEKAMDFHWFCFRVCIYIYAPMYIYIYIHVHMYTYLYIFIHIHV